MKVALYGAMRCPRFSADFRLKAEDPPRILDPYSVYFEILQSRIKQGAYKVDDLISRNCTTGVLIGGDRAATEALRIASIKPMNAVETCWCKSLAAQEANTEMLTSSRSRKLNWG